MTEKIISLIRMGFEVEFIPQPMHEVKIRLRYKNLQTYGTVCTDTITPLDDIIAWALDKLYTDIKVSMALSMYSEGDPNS